MSAPGKEETHANQATKGIQDLDDIHLTLRFKHLSNKIQSSANNTLDHSTADLSNTNNDQTSQKSFSEYFCLKNTK